MQTAESKGDDTFDKVHSETGRDWFSDALYPDDGGFRADEVPTRRSL